MTGPRHERGFALLLVVWVLATLSVLAAGFAATTRSETRLARNFVEVARARALAEAGVSTAIAHLLDPTPSGHWRADGTPYAIAFAGGQIRIKIEDESGKIDVNVAPPEMIAGLCAVLGLDDTTSALLLEGILSRRRIAAARLAAGAGAAPQIRRLAAFTAIDELMQIPGFDRASFERLRPYLTVFSQSAAIDPLVAPQPVLLAIPGVDVREVERLLVARAAPVAEESSPFAPALTGVDDYITSGALGVATIIAEATTDTGTVFARRAVMASTDVVGQPGQILEWRQEVEGALDERVVP